MSTRAAALILLLAVLLIACPGGAPRPDPLPEPDPDAGRGEADPAPDDPREPSWVPVDAAELGVAFELPPTWEQRVSGDLFLVNAPRPDDDAVVVFMRTADDRVRDALDRLDATFPMKDIRYHERNRERDVNGLAATFGEGLGFSTDFNATLRFFIMHIKLPQHSVLVAAYIREDAFDARRPTLLKIIESIRRR